MKENLFEQMNASAYKDSTNPFDALYEAGHFGNVADYTTASSEEDPENGSFREGEPAKKIHNMTQAEIEAQRQKLIDDEEAENKLGQQEHVVDPEDQFGFGRFESDENTEVPLEYRPDMEAAINPEDEETFGSFSDEAMPDTEFNSDNAFNDLDNPEAVMGDLEPGPGGPADTGTPSIKLPTTFQNELIKQLLDNPMTKDELMTFLKSKLG